MIFFSQSSRIRISQLTFALVCSCSEGLLTTEKHHLVPFCLLLFCILCLSIQINSFFFLDTQGTGLKSVFHLLHLFTDRTDPLFRFNDAGGGKGGIRVDGIAVLSFFFKRYLVSVILILMCRIAVSSALRCAVFKANYSVKENHSRKVLRYRSFALSCLIHVNIEHFRLNDKCVVKQFLTVNL